MLVKKKQRKFRMEFGEGCWWFKVVVVKKVEGVNRVCYGDAKTEMTVRWLYRVKRNENGGVMVKAKCTREGRKKMLIKVTWSLEKMSED